MDEPFNDITDFKSEVAAYDNLKRDYEKITIDYELKIEQLNKEINFKSVNYENLRIDFLELDSKYKNICDEKIEVNKNYSILSQEKFNIVRKFDNLESEHGTLLELISRREKELLNSKIEIQELKSQLIDFKNNEIEVKLNTNDLDYRRKDFERMEQMSITRNKKLCADIKLLEEQLTEYKKENFEEKSQHNKIVYQLNLDSESKRNEIKNLKRINEKLKEKINHLENVNEEKTESLRHAVESQTNIDNLLRKELNVQISISDLYKEEKDECLSREKSLINAITELQETLKETYEENDKIKNEYKSSLGDYSQQLSQLRLEINKKDNELINANELLEKFRIKGLTEDELKAMNPATASAISALKQGYSMTQIYSEYLQMVNERDELRVDRDRLNEYMLSILDELEEKAPLLKKQQDEHSHLQLAVSTLGKKYDENLSQLLSFQSELLDCRSKCDQLTKKLRREEQTSADLGNQVCCLLREIETSRGTVIRGNDSSYSLGMVCSGRPSNQGDQATTFISNAMQQLQQRSLIHQSQSITITNNISTNANDVITTHLVTFKNICELQQRNIQLIEQLRDLSEQQEAADQLINDSSMQELAKKLEQAYREIDEIRDKQKQNKQLMKTIDGQRHLIQALTTLNGNKSLTINMESGALNIEGTSSLDDISQCMIPTSSDGDKRIHHHDNHSSNSTNTICVLNNKLIDNQEKLDKLQSDIDNMRNNKEILKDKHNKITEELNRQLSDAKINNANLLSKISFNQEKSSSLEQNLINRQLELSELQTELADVCQQLAQKTEEHKGVSNESSICHSRIDELESELKKLQQNMKHIASLEEQIAIEKSEKYQLIMSTSNLAKQISNLQTVFVKQQTTDQSTDDQIELKSRIKQLSLELKQEKSKYQNSLEVWQSKFSESSSKIDSLTSQLNNINHRPNTMNNLVISDSCTIGVLQHTNSTTEKREKTSDLESQLEDLNVTNKSLKQQLESYQELMSNSESKLISNAQLIEEMEARFQAQIDEERQKNSDMEELLENVRMAYEQVEEEYKSVKRSLDDQIETLNKKCEENNNVVNSLNEEIVSMKSKEARLKADLERQRKLTREATENYQQELIFHSQESDALQELTDQMNKYQKHERDIAEKLQEAILLRDQYKNDLEKVESSFNEVKKTLENEIVELRAQKESMNNRFFDLNDHVINLKKMLDPSIECGIDHAIIQRESDWNDVIKYLRQEKESAEKIKNQFEIELLNYKSQCSILEEKIQQLNNVLEEERRFKVLEVETNKQHSEVMRKLELNQMLTESNAMLRQDRDRLIDELADKTMKLEKLQDDIEPLKCELRARISDIDSVKLDSRSLKNERDLWRVRCDNLIEKSKQVNPEDFKQMCLEKDNLKHRLMLEEDKCKLHVAKIQEMQNEIDSQLKSIQEMEEEMDSLKKVNDENMATLRRNDGLIIQLKEIGRKYRAETESQKIEIDVKEEKIRELQPLRKELVETKMLLEESRRNIQQYQNAATSSSSSLTNFSNINDEFINKISTILQCQNTTKDIIEHVDKVMKSNQNNIHLLEKCDSEHKMRNQAIEGHLTKLKLDNERLKKQLLDNTRINNQNNNNSNNNILEDDNTTNTNSNTTSIGNNTTTMEDSNYDSLQPTLTWHAVPTVARVAANVHPVVQKPQNIPSNQISPNSQPISSCTTSTARQTAEIRPIHAIPIHVIATNNNNVITPSDNNNDLVSSASVTTSLPTSVVQALAASSVIFPTINAFSSITNNTTSNITTTITANAISSISSNANRMKRCFQDTIEPSDHSRNIQMSEQPSSSSSIATTTSMEPSNIKKIRIRMPEQQNMVFVQEILNNRDNNNISSIYQDNTNIESHFNNNNNNNDNMDNVCNNDDVELQSEEVDNVDDDNNNNDDDYNDGDKIRDDDNIDDNDDDNTILQIINDGTNRNDMISDDIVSGDDDEDDENDDDEEDEDEDEDEYNDNEDNDDDEDEDDNNDDEDDDDDDDDEDDNNRDMDNDDDEDDDDDDGDVIINLLSSDDGDGNDGNNTNNTNDTNTNNDNVTTNNNDNIPGQSTHSINNNSFADDESKIQYNEMELAKKKIEPIVWTDNNQRKNSFGSKMILSSVRPELGKSIKCITSPGNIGFRRKVATSRRNFPFGPNRGGISQGRRSGGPFKGRYVNK